MDERTIEEIIAAFDAYKEKAAGEPTLFSVLGRSFDEDLLSRLVLKCLLDDPGVISNLLAACDRHREREGIAKEGICECEGRCEQVTEGLSRVDVFIKGRNARGQGFVLLIENKIASWEHDEQTKTYADWAKHAYEEDTVYCVFLKPSWNGSVPSAEKDFAVITYSDLAKMFTIDNRFIEELKLHIANHLEVNETMDPIIAKHSKELFKIVGDLERQRNDLAKEINREVHRLFSGVKLTEDHSPSYGVWRYYAKDLHWWDEGYRYYFYIEFKIGEDGDFSKVCVQRTLKTYAQSAERLDAFIGELNQHSVDLKSEPAFRHYWIHVWDISPMGEVLSKEWNLSVKEQVLEKLKIAFEEQKRIVEEFLKSKYSKPKDE